MVAGALTDTSRIKVVQRALTLMGVAQLKDDGVWGPVSQAALKKWEGATGNGVVSADEYAYFEAKVRSKEPKYAALPPLPPPPPKPQFPAPSLEGYAAPVQTATAAVLPAVLVDQQDLISKFGSPWEDPDAWRKQWIVAANIPAAFGSVFKSGKLWCNKYIVPVVEATFKELEKQGLAPLIKEYGGCWNIRSSRGSTTNWSKHTWGVAIDINMTGNGLGEKPVLDPRVVAVFKKAGWVWGGDWKRQDGMHFQYVAKG